MYIFPLLLLLLGAVFSAQRGIPSRRAAQRPSWRHEQAVKIIKDAKPGPCEPTEVRLAIGDRPDEMRITWRTTSPDCPSSLTYSESSELFRRSESGLCSTSDPSHRVQPKAARPLCSIPPGVGSRAYGASTVYTKNLFCGSPATDFDLDPVVTHSAVVPALEPGTTYFYQIDGANGTTGSFIGPPTVGPDSNFVFVSYMDQGEPQDQDVTGSPGGGITARYAASEVDSGAALVFHMGDVAYANGDPTVWDRYLSMVEGYAKLIPYMVGAGNHEHDYSNDIGGPDVSGTRFQDLPHWSKNDASGGECGVPFKFRFNMPRPQGSPRARDLANPPFWYSFEYGSAHFFVLSSEHQMGPESPQYKWLLEDLKSVDRCRTPWVIGGMHRPMYVSKLGEDKDISFEIRADLEPVLLEHRVNVMLYGHTHYYERSCVARESRCVREDEGGVLHLCLGTGGHMPSSDGGIWEPWKVASEVTYGYGRLSIRGPDDLLFEFISTTDGLVHDEVAISNSFDFTGQCQPTASHEDSDSDSDSEEEADGTAPKRPLRPRSFLFSLWRSWLRLTHRMT